MRLPKLSNKEKKNEGFTLVELIVVIVILAILAAILVPALLGYIDKAKQQQIVLNGKSVLTAAQAEASSAYAKGAAPASISTAEILKVADVESVCDSFVIGFKASYDADKELSAQHAAYTVSYVAYTENGNTIYYNLDATTNVGTWEGTEVTSPNSAVSYTAP
ncbi:MAG: type II secretion system protein [Wujia sp.]